MIERLAHQLIENHLSFENSCIIGIQPRGVMLSDRIVAYLEKQLNTKIEYGKLDITFYRDDFRRSNELLMPSEMDFDFIVEDKPVVLIDDVLYTGRTIHAALTALQQFGRPSTVELLTLVDRRFNRHVPIRADYTGITIDALAQEYVKVRWDHPIDGNQIVLYSSKEDVENDEH